MCIAYAYVTASSVPECQVQVDCVQS